MVTKTRQYRVQHAGGEFYRLQERRPKPIKGKRWKTIAIGTKRMYDIARKLNGGRL